MNDTSLSLLERIVREPDGPAWSALSEIYEPLLRSWLSRFQLQEADVDDVVQEVLLHVSQQAAKFEHSGRPGAFRSWLRTVMVYRLQKHWRERRRHPLPTKEVLAEIDELSDPHSGVSRLWDQEHDRHVAKRLLDIVRPRFSTSTWEAFRMTVLEGKHAQDVANHLGISCNAVCIAKSRVMKELRETGQGLLDQASDSGKVL